MLIGTTQMKKILRLSAIMGMFALMTVAQPVHGADYYPDATLPPPYTTATYFAGDRFFILPGITVDYGGPGPVFRTLLDNWLISNKGLIIGHRGFGVIVSQRNDGFFLYNQAGGVIRNEGAGLINHGVLLKELTHAEINNEGKIYGGGRGFNSGLWAFDTPGLMVDNSGELHGGSGFLNYGAFFRNSYDINLTNTGLIEGGTGFFNTGAGFIKTDKITIDNSGTISGGRGGAAFGDGLYFGFVDDLTLTNTGTIQGGDGNDSNGVYFFFTSNSELINRGTIQGGADGDGEGIEAAGLENLQIYNYGDILGGDDGNGIKAYGDEFEIEEGCEGEGVFLVNGVGPLITFPTGFHSMDIVDLGIFNYGTIQGGGGGGPGNDGVDVSDAQNLTIMNYGKIQGGSGTDADGLNIEDSTIINVTNNGLIQGGAASESDGIELEDSSNFTLNNYGTINGGGGRAIYLEDTASDMTFNFFDGSEIIGDIEAEQRGTNLRININNSTTPFRYAYDILRFDRLDIQIGAAFFDGTIDAANVYLYNGAFLGGNGIFTGTLHNSGMLAAGHSIGAMTMGGYAQSSTATLEVEFSATDNDYYSVTNDAAINGGLLDAKPVGLVRGESRTFVFLSAGNLITGDFDDFRIPVAFNAYYTFDYAADTISITFTRNPYGTIGWYHNQTETGRLLDQNVMTATGDLEDILIYLDNLYNETDIRKALTEISGEHHASFGPISAMETDIYVESLMGHFSGGGFGEYGFGASASQNPTPTAFDDSTRVASAYGKSPAGRWEGFGGAYGRFSRLDSFEEHFGYRADTGGGLIGGNYWFSDEWAAGFGAGQSRTAVYWDGGPSEGQIDTTHVSIHGGLISEDFYAVGLAAYGYNSYSLRRSINFGPYSRMAQSNHDGHEFSSFLGGGYRMLWKNLAITPAASMKYVMIYENPRTEKGASSLNMDVKANYFQSLRSRLGLEAAYDFGLHEDVSFTPRIRGTWIHEFMDSMNSNQQILIGAAGHEMLIESRDLGRDGLEAALGFSLIYKENTAVFADYALNYGFDGYSSHWGMVGVKFSF